MYNEILPLITEKQKILEANEQSVYKLLVLFSKTSDVKPKSYHCTAKSQAKLFLKKFIPVCPKDLKFLIMRCSKVTKMYSHYTFEQSRLKRDFVLMNQKY